MKDPERDALLDGRRDDWALEDYSATWRSSEGAHPLDRLLDLNLRTYLLDDLLVKADRMSMAHGLELRSPFLDVELLELASRLPPRLKARGLSLKRVLKAAVADIVPKEILQPPEAGLRRTARPLVPRGPAWLCRLDPRSPRRESQGAPGRSCGGSVDRRARRPHPRPRLGAVDAARARGIPEARGMVSDAAVECDWQ